MSEDKAPDIDLTIYLEKLEKLQKYLDFGIDVSDACAGQKDVDWHLVRANQLYIRLTVSCLSYIRLLPYNRYFPADHEFWDLFSILSISRNIIETYIMFWYIAVDGVSQEERQLRLDILMYHLNNEKYKFYRDFNPESEYLPEFETQLPLKKREFEDSEIFATYIEKSRRKNILSGKEAKYLSNNEIMEKMPFKTEEFVPLYRFFSNHTHSMPFAFFSLDNQRGSGRRNQAEIDYIDMSLDFVTKYLLCAIMDTIGLFPFREDELDTDKLKVIREEYITYSQNL